MSAILSLSQTDVFTALRAFLLSVLPAGAEVVAAQDNGVPMPAGPFVAMTYTGIRRLSTNVASYTDPGTNPGSKAITDPSEFTVQLDFYGPQSGDWAVIVQTLMRDDYGYWNFPSGIKPLYADDPAQMPLITGEQQYEQRWKLDVRMQINPVVTVPMDFADQLEVGVYAIEEKFPA